MENLFVNGKSKKFMFINNIMDDVIKYVICFILGWLMSRMMGNGYCVGGRWETVGHRGGHATQDWVEDPEEPEEPEEPDCSLSLYTQNYTSCVMEAGDFTQETFNNCCDSVYTGLPECIDECKNMR